MRNLVFVVIFVSACGASQTGIPCSSSSNCPTGMLCDETVGECYTPKAADAKVPDSDPPPDADARVGTDGFAFKLPDAGHEVVVPDSEPPPDARPVVPDSAPLRPDTLPPPDTLPAPKACATSCLMAYCSSVAAGTSGSYCAVASPDVCPSNAWSPPCPSACSSDADCCAGKCVSGGCYFTAGQPCAGPSWCAPGLSCKGWSFGTCGAGGSVNDSTLGVCE